MNRPTRLILVTSAGRRNAIGSIKGTTQKEEPAMT